MLKLLQGYAPYLVRGLLVGFLGTPAIARAVENLCVLTPTVTAQGILLSTEQAECVMKALENEKQERSLIATYTLLDHAQTELSARFKLLDEKHTQFETRLEDNLGECTDTAKALQQSIRDNDRWYRDPTLNLLGGLILGIIAEGVNRHVTQ